MLLNHWEAHMVKKAGKIGDISIFSFNGNKIITTSSGECFSLIIRVYMKKQN